MSMISFLRSVAAKGAPLALVFLLALMTVQPADARAGGGFSFGSRGTRTFSMPSATPTAPRSAQPFQHGPSPAFGATRPGGFGFGSGLLAGLLGAGLMGSMFGGGFFYGIAALIGLVFKLGLIVGLVWLVLRFFRRGLGGPVMAGSGRYARTPLDGGLPGSAPSAPGAPPSGTPATVGPEDYAAFEQALGAVQDAYSREDLAMLARLATPEMARALQAELDGNRRRGLRNEVTRTRLVNGDLSEAWAEGAATYATVAMRFEAIDVMIDRASGRVVSGDTMHPVQAVELWTFRREGRGGWVLSAIQQAS